MTKLSEHQLEQLSAYLDGELPAHERIAVEQQLQDNPALTAELREMQTMLAMLRDVPAVQPPRTFTLDPAQYGRQPRAGFGLMRWASLLGALALMLTVGLTLSRQGGIAFQTQVNSDGGDVSVMRAEATQGPAMEDTMAAGSAPDATTAPAAAGGSEATVAAPEATSDFAAAPTLAAALAAPPESAGMATEAAMGDEQPAQEAPPDLVLSDGAATATAQAYMALQSNPTSAPLFDTAANPANTTVDMTTESLRLTETNPLPYAAGAVPQTTDTSSPDTRDLEQQQKTLPEPQLAEPPSAAAGADESPALWLLFLIATLVGIGGTIILGRVLRRVE